MIGRIRAISIDLDDTLWEVGPVIRRAEEAVHAHLAEHFPCVVQQFDVLSMREVRVQVGREFPELAHDLTALRRISLERMLEAGEYGATEAETLMARFLDLRHEVVLFPDVLPALRVLSQKFPLVALSNGNADVFRLPIGEYFCGAVSARGAGVSKPHPEIYRRVAELLELGPAEILHVGDHPVDDVQGGAVAGMATVWVNRDGRSWSGEPAPDYTVSSLSDMLALF
ncbi:MAG: HAD-IA family hydrolase [Pseudomonadota bacterium]|nr:HAD-IA family hydrolase [Pseudomonadota bacterium]